MKKTTTKLQCHRSILTVFLVSMLFSLEAYADLVQVKLNAQQQSAWWKIARSRMEEKLKDQQRTILDIESPKWYEIPYQTLGRMPIVDTGLREPLSLPEIALWADSEVQKTRGRFEDLLHLGIQLSEDRNEIASIYPPEPTQEWADEVQAQLEKDGLPEEFIRAMGVLMNAAGSATTLRKKAFEDYSKEEMITAGKMIPEYFVRETPAGEMVRGYTCNVDECVDLMMFLQKIRFEHLREAAGRVAGALDVAGPLLERSRDAMKKVREDYRFEKQTPIGLLLIKGPGNDVWTEEAALSVDLGGDDVFLNHPARSAPDGAACAIHIDLDGNDTYKSDGYAHGSAIAGIAAFIDLTGNDTYVSGHYSQGAALCGTSFFLDRAGDDDYRAGFGAQGFAIFGTSIFVEGGGRDCYRCSAMGQASASTLGVSIVYEMDGDDDYRAGGDYGFYYSWDSSCAQGAASGMRPWPPTNKRTVYGGVGFLCEAAGNDIYHAYNVGQGGSYVFALGMLVDSEGNDTYTSKNYCRGVGVHLSGAVAVDKSGDDLHNGLYGQNGYSLDRSSGVFIDFMGDDTYRTSGGIGFGHKPKGCGIFVDVFGDDTYAGWENNYGKADYPFGDDAYSTGFFLDLSGDDSYPDPLYADDSIWREGEFGYGEDCSVANPESGNPMAGSWAETAGTRENFMWNLQPAGQPFASYGDRRDDRYLMQEELTAPCALERFTALGKMQQSPMQGLEAAGDVAHHGNRAARRQLIDFVEELLLLKKIGPQNSDALQKFLMASDYDMRLLGLMAVRKAKLADAHILDKVRSLLEQDPQIEVRAMAALTLGGCEKTKEWTALAKALKDPSWQVRRRVAMGLGELKARESADALQRVLMNDESFQARGHAAMALGKIKTPSAEDVLMRALQDKNEFVRICAARTLTSDFGWVDGIPALISELAWANWPMKEQWAYNFLMDFTGKSIKPEVAAWSEWWTGEKADFDFGRCMKIYAMLIEAGEARDRGDDARHLELHRKIVKKMPDHARVKKELAEELNGEAWDIVVSGVNLEKGIELAMESVRVQKSAGALDTLAVIYFLGGDKEKALATIDEAIGMCTEAEKPSFEERRGEFMKGAVNVR